MIPLTWDGAVRDEAQPLVSMLVLTLNAELTIGDFVDWCFDGLRESGLEGCCAVVHASALQDSRRPRVLEPSHG